MFRIASTSLLAAARVGRWLLFFVIGAPTLLGQTADLYLKHCASCHGPSGEGSRGPALRVPALRRANDVESLVALLRRGVPASEMAAIPATVINDLQIGALAAYVLAMRTGSTPASSGAARGAELFRTKGKCLDCHRLNGEGRPLAPDLSAIGRDRDTTWLRRALTDPRADIYDSFGGYRWTIQLPDNYLLVEVTTTKGERVAGSRLNEDAFSVQLRDGEGRIRSFLKSELANLQKRWGESPMPSYKDVFSASELDDIVAYLASLGRPR
jgi:putative heme-binding domain-containing protein